MSLFSIDGPDSRIIEPELRNTHRVHVKYRSVGELHGVRVSPHVYMLEEELARFVWALELLVAARR